MSHLAVGGNTADGVYDFTFTLFGASVGGSAIAGVCSEFVPLPTSRRYEAGKRMSEFHLRRAA